MNQGKQRETIKDAGRDDKRLRQIVKENKSHLDHECDQSSGYQCMRGFTLYVL